MPIIVSGSGGQTVISGSNSDGYQVISGSGNGIVLSGSSIIVPSGSFTVSGSLYVSGSPGNTIWNYGDLYNFGKIGIGTSSPTYDLDVDGTGRFTGNLIVTGTLDAHVEDFKVSANTMTLGDASGDTVTINASTVATPNGLNFDSNTLVVDASNDRVGIGTDTPQRQLHIENADTRVLLKSTATNSNCQIRFETTALETTIGANIKTNGSQFEIVDTTNNVARLTMDNAGKVGIGVSDPDTALEVLSTSAQQKWSYDGTYSATMTVDNSGNASLAAAGGITLDGSGGNILLDASGDITLDAAGNEIYLKDAGVEFARFSSADGMLLSGSAQITGSLLVSGSAAIIGGEAQAATLTLSADQGDDAADTTTISVADGGNFTVDCALDIELNADGGDITLKDGTQTAMSIDMATTAGDAIFKDADGAEIFRIDGSADSLLMAGTKKIEFTDANAYIHHDGTDLKIADDADINLVASTDILLDAGGDVKVEANGSVKVYLDANSDGSNLFGIYAGNVSAGTGASTAVLSVTEAGSMHLSGTSAYLTIEGSEGDSAWINLYADQGDDSGDQWGMYNLAGSGNQLAFYNNISGDSLIHFKYVPNATLSSGYLWTTGSIRVGGGAIGITGSEGGSAVITMQADEADDAADVTVISVVDGGNFTIDCGNDIELNADGGQVTIKDDSASHFLFDCDNTALTIYDDSDDGDLFKIQVAAKGATTISTIDDDAAEAHLTLDPDGEIILDTGGNNIEFKKAGTSALSVMLVSTGSGPSVQFKNMNTSAYAELRFINATGGINAASINNGGYGGFTYKRAIHTVSGSDLNLSAISLTGAMGYCGSILKCQAINGTDGSGDPETTIITLPTTTTEDGAKQLMGYQLRVMLDTPAAGAIKIVRGDTSNDYLFGYIVDASANAAPAALTLGGTGPGGGGKSYIQFEGGGVGAVGDYVDIVAVAATDDLVKWLVTGVAST